MKNKRILTLLLATALLLSFTASCTKKVDSDSVGTQAETTQVEETSEESITDHLEKQDFGGKVFTVATTSEVHWAGLDRIHVDEMNGDILNDSTYTRNSKVEDRFNVKIDDVKLRYDTMAESVKKSINAGDHTYDAVYMWGNYAYTMALDGYLYEFSKLPNIDLSKPYWDQNAKTQLTLGNHLFFMTGDANMFYNDATWVMMFNKQLVKDYKVEDPYAVVKSGKWTYDKMLEMAKPIISDLNGDGKFDGNDRYGMITHSETISGMFYASGEQLFVKNADDIPELNLNDGRVLTVLEKINTMFSKDNFMYDVTSPKNIAEAGFDAIQKMFMANQSLFCAEVLECVRRYRAMETDFGLLPLPKLDEQQKEYASYILSNFTALCVPADTSADDATFIGTILEALQSESHSTLLPAYYTTALEGKYLRDEESAEMLQIILGNRSYPIGVLKDFGDSMGSLRNLILNGKTEFASTIEKSRKKIEKDISKLVDNLEMIS